MRRRDFIGTTAAAGTYLAFGGIGRALAAEGKVAQLPFDLVAVKGGEPGAMFDLGIKALGGMGAFVKKGQKVLVKPNIGWNVPPERAGNTNPELVARIVEQCRAAGAKEVYVFDHSCDFWEGAYKSSGIAKAAKDAGAKVAPAHEAGYYQEVAVSVGKVLKKEKVHELLLSADVFINVPILKDHSVTDVTVGMKNLMGVIWDRGFWHGNDLNQCIADFAGYRKPDLTVVDAYNVLTKYGPRPTSADHVKQMKTQLLGVDPVALDVAAVKLLGKDPNEIEHIKLAGSQGRGRMDLEKLRIERLTI